jgi:hypothetical protein
VPRLQNFPRQPLPRNDSGLASEARRSRLALLVWDALLVRPGALRELDDFRCGMRLTIKVFQKIHGI